VKVRTGKFTEITEEVEPTHEQPQSSGRIDTTLTLRADSQVTITAGVKSITLYAGRRYYVMNAPLRYVTNHDATVHGASHIQVYCAMTGANPMQCQNLVTRLEAGEGTSPCGADFRIRNNSDPNPSPIVNPLNQIIDFACSNSQWP
jgi:hypothetical protein